MNDKLTTQEQDFIKEVIKTGNKTEAVVKAFKEKDKDYAGVKGHRLIRKDKIQNAIAPIVKKWEIERDRLTEALKNKDLDKETMRDIVNALDTLTKNIQLLSGKATDNVKVIPISNEFIQDSN